MQDRPVTLAAITGAHGVAGEVRLKLFGEGLDMLKAHTSFNDGALTLKKVKSDNKGGAIARFAQVTDRTAAEKLRGTVLTVPRSALPDPGEGEYYHADLLGLAAVSDAGDPLGTVVAVENFGATDIVEIERPATDGKPGKTFMVPLTKQAVPGWDAERLVVSADFAD
ncbi:ribosome maturation factor RimM [Qipengyuania sp. JC766]|uniref:ribosome maturation factor RimM n=1 Tax=Qipengyuania sp. JC766 TaxID=3232139 RepID=UPI003457F94D